MLFNMKNALNIIILCRDEPLYKIVFVHCNTSRVSVVTCPPIDVQIGEIYTNTTCTSSAKNYMDTCEMTCIQGYRLTGSTGVRLCTENGHWSNVATCEGTIY